MQRLLRRAWRAPGFVLPVLLLVGVAIAVNAATFGALHRLAWQTLPFRDAEHLVELRLDLRDIGLQVGLSDALAQLLRQDEAAFAGVAGAIALRPVDDESGQPWRVQRATASFTDVLGVAPALGRPFIASDVAGTGAPPLLLSHAAWRARFGGADALGRRVMLGGVPHVVVGVMPRGFAFPDAGVDAWVPYVATAAEREQDAMGGFGQFTVVARLVDGADATRARDSLAAVLAAAPMFERLRGSGANFAADARPWRDRYAAGHLKAATIVQLAALLLLLVAASNVSSLVMSRVLARRHELAVCRALGAGRGHLLRALAGDLAVPSVLGLVAGVAFAPVLSRALGIVGLVPATLPGDAAPAWLGAALAALAMLSALAATLALAWPLVARQQGAALQGRGAVAGLGNARLVLVIAQVAFTTMLAGAAGLLLRSAFALVQAERGFDAQGVLMTTVEIPPDVMTPAAPIASALRERIAALPGVRHAAVADAMPFGASHFIERVRPRDGGEPLSVRAHAVGPGYFAALGMPLLRGSDFAASAAAAEVIVDEHFRRQWFGDANPIGATIAIAQGEGGDMRQARIVGVVPAVRFRALDDDSAQPAIYQRLVDPGSVFFIAARSDADPAALVAPVRTLVRELAPQAVLTFNAPLADAIAQTLQPRFAVLRLVGPFALMTLLLAALGLYAALSVAVQSRAAEIGVRLALGAAPPRILRLLAAQAGKLLVAGMLVGLAAGLTLARVLADQFYRVAPTDVSTWVLVCGAVLLTSAIACIVPAVRAMRIAPRTALAAA